MQYCSATRTDKRPCTAPATASGQCYWHDPTTHAARIEAARRGGKHAGERLRLLTRLGYAVLAERTT